MYSDSSIVKLNQDFKMVEVSTIQDLTPDQLRAILNWGFSMQDYGPSIPEEEDPTEWVDYNFGTSTATELVQCLITQYGIRRFLFNKSGYFVTEDNQWGD